MMMRDPYQVQRGTHGGHCECEQLAAALGCDPSTISFDFCLRVLQRHWRINCRHGSTEDAPRRSIAQHWKDAGPTDAVKAILISNAPEES
ncbi:hypothetical protein GCM10028796_05140 [Ramlibacter monticola]|uniref:Uncharacterized protein n=1 Tax=Ramlibacter monticola TaxID=1926872 RepID=A0A936YXM2_9BURK|nr:hypothetical protein [Ramlibacter monticola]MBL0391208.1 hypothetical protein [Ramlibacter monticola]